MEEERIVLLTDEVTELADQKNWQALRELLCDEAPQDIAILMQDLDDRAMPLVFRLLPKELAAETFVEMPADSQETLIAGFSDAELKDVISELYVDDAADIVEEMPANLVKRILASADSDTRKAINEILKYPDDSAGSIMTTEYVRLDRSLTVDDAFKRIRRVGVDKETVYTCYVTESDKKLIGFVTVKDLLLADGDTLIGDVMTTDVIYAYTTDDREAAVNEMAKYDFIALPVVDGEKRLVGIITVDDAIDVIQDENTEDIEKMAAITPSDKPYLRTGVLSIWLHRIPWLLLLMVSATFTGGIITSFEESLAAVSALTAFIPMLMDTGGNAGSQTSVTVIRGLALGEISPRDIFKVIGKEACVSLLCGLTLAAANYIKIILVDNMILGSNVSNTVALVVCLTLAVTVVIAKLVGCMLPILAKIIGADPAVMASPFITTIVDALSLLVYFNIATAMIAELQI